mmetsp:Transcript_73388/g.212592  ORF Transcript_73388/g.212592 Transcript_73388/m.212592 type:complete len:81 (+) Transcript_73388:264-506(+)
MLRIFGVAAGAAGAPAASATTPSTTGLGALQLLHVRSWAALRFEHWLHAHSPAALSSPLRREVDLDLEREPEDRVRDRDL